MCADRTILSQFLTNDGCRNAGATIELCSVILDVGLACRAIAEAVMVGAYAGRLEPVAVGDDTRVTAKAAATALFMRAIESNAQVAGIWCEGMPALSINRMRDEKGRYLVVFASVDRPSNLDVNLPVGTIFSVLHAPNPAHVGAADFLQAGGELVCAGYALYGASTNLVLSVGAGVHGFTLDPVSEEFVLTHPDLEIPATTNDIAADTSHSSRWEPGLRRYLSECLAGAAGARGRRFNVRGSCSLVAEAHRILVRGGVFLSPRDGKEPNAAHAVHLLHQASPVAFLIEQARGRATTGRERVLGRVPHTVDEEVGLIFGSREEVERIEQYQCDNNLSAADSPLFGIRGLFRAPT